MRSVGLLKSQSNSSSAWSQGWTRFRASKAAVAAGLFVVFLVILALFGPLISPETYASFNHTQGGLHPHIGWRYMLGTDVFGHSIVMYLVLGARSSFGLSLVAALLASAIGAPIGFVVGWAGGWLDCLGMVIVRAGLTIPFFPLLLVLAAYSGGRNPWFLVLIFGIVSSLGPAYLLRNVAAGIKMKSLTEARVLAGLTPFQIWRRHAMTELMPSIVLALTLAFNAILAADVTIDFLGIGLNSNNPSWGTALSLAPAYIQAGLWWWYLLPGMAVFAALLAVNTAGFHLYSSLLNGKESWPLEDAPSQVSL